MARCRLSITCALSVLALQAATMVLLVGWYRPVFQRWANGPLHSGRVHVLLLSSWRSGSSFLGQAFSQHPDVFYLMEPAWHVWGTLGRVGAAATLRMAARDLLRSVFLCDFSVYESYTPDTRNHSSLFMWSHSRALCSPPACTLTPQGEFSRETACESHCDAVGLDGAAAACRSYSHVVLKEVRFFELESLFPLLRDPSLDLRIVHLVRDPRAVFKSREASVQALEKDSALILKPRDAKAADAPYRVLREICRGHVRIHETATVKAPTFLHSRYKLVRYEDLVRNPIGTIEEIYTFTGLVTTARMQKWIYWLTHGRGSSAREAFQITSRNAEDVSQAWRTSLSFQQVQRVQDVCRAAMDLLGYQSVESEQEQKHLELDLLTSRHRKKFTWLPSNSTLQAWG